MDKLFLIDAYALIFRSYYAFIKNPRINSKGLNTSAILGFVNTLEEILAKENPSHIAVAFDPKGGTFRHELYKEYKAQREETPEVIRQSVPIIKDILNAYNIRIYEVPGFEADDVIGTLSHQADTLGGITTYMMTPDKDYCQLVSDSSFVYRPRFGDKGYDILGIPQVLEKYGLENTLQVIDMLGLMGDSADNIPGCPGVGEKTAIKLINEFGGIDGLLANTDKLKGALKDKVEKGREQIIFSRMLATIKTDVPVELNMDDLKRREPDTAKLTQLFQDLEFRSLFKKHTVAPGTDTELPLEKIQSIEQNDNRPTNSKRSKKEQGFHGDLFGGESEAESDRNNVDLFSQTQESDGNKSVFQNLSDINSIGHNYYLIDNEVDARRISEILLTSDYICFDTETTSTNAIQAKIVGISFSIKEHEAWFVSLTGTEDEKRRILEIFKPVLENPNILKIGQNLKYDILVLSGYGIDVEGQMFDTMIAHYVLQPEMKHGMDYLAEIYLGYRTIPIESLIGEGRSQKNMSELSALQIYEYACEDADITLQLKPILEKELEKDGTVKPFTEIEMPLVKVLAYMERNGVRIDPASLAETSELFSRRMAEIEEKIYSLAGTKFNILSPKQVGEILFESMHIMDKPKKTKTGQYVTSEEVLETLRADNQIVDEILKYRGLKKLLGTYVDALPQIVNHDTGKIHTSFNQAVTATGRLSSTNPNLQNIPVRDEDGKEVRKAFIAEDGCKFFSADYSQIELRIMAHLSGDESMIEDFLKGHDIHTATAAKVFKKRIEDVTKQERSRAKTANFGIIYGISAFGLAQRMGVSRTEAKQIIDSYFVTYSGVKKYMEHSIEIARNNGYITTLTGRKRYLPDILSHNATVRGFAERNAINAPIQGSAADIIKKAMIAIFDRFKKEKLKSTMILQVHDELNFNVVPGEEEIVQSIVIEEMQNAWPMRIPLIADCGWGNNWLEAH
ncbi:MAG: DNA polymerase I [Bacteroidaceae bacterium]|nr:DNA polymerase I [Bacteroidaceae bacterium]